MGGNRDAIADSIYCVLLFSGGGASNTNFNEGSGGRNGGGGDSQVQNDTIFVQNLPKSATTKDLETSFGAIGIIKLDKRTKAPKIWIYKDKNTGEGKGEATITYDDPEAAGAAINWFNGKSSSTHLSTDHS